MAVFDEQSNEGFGHVVINSNNTRRFASKIVHDNRFITGTKQLAFYALIT